MGFSWLELMRGNGTALRDGDHEIGVYKCENTEIMTGQLIYFGILSENFERSDKIGLTWYLVSINQQM